MKQKTPPTVSYEYFRQALERFDIAHDPNRSCSLENLAALRKHFADYFDARERDEAVFGIDIYRYSSMAPEQQRLIPSVFRLLHNEAFRQCCEREEFLFPNTLAVGNFISTGDGGFQIFATPLHAVVFAVAFQTWLTAFNSSFHFPTLRAVFDRPLTVRYTLTYDRVFRQNGNIFGAGIINNARIIARDTLNRFLVDQGTVHWFETQLASVESLLTLRGTDLPNMQALVGESRKAARSALFSRNDETGIRSVHLQKIGIVKSKETEADIFNLVIQVVVPQTAGARTAVVTVGNLNTAGIAV